MSLYYSDPDQNMVELQVDNFGDWDASAEWMRTAEDFRRDPIGSFFDPDLVLAAHQGGASFEQIQTGTRQGKYPPKKPPHLNLPSLG
jgi:catechol 2,3-dioxygenase